MSLPTRKQVLKAIKDYKKEKARVDRLVRLIGEPPWRKKP
jgi:hypothetical protein